MKKALEPDATANKRPSVEVIGIGGGGTQMGGMPGYGTGRSAGRRPPVAPLRLRPPRRAAGG